MKAHCPEPWFELPPRRGFTQAERFPALVARVPDRLGRIDVLVNPGGVSPDRRARAMPRGIARDRENVAVGGREAAGLHLRRFAPGRFSRTVRRLSFSA